MDLYDQTGLGDPRLYPVTDTRGKKRNIIVALGTAGVNLTLQIQVFHIVSIPCI